MRSNKNSAIATTLAAALAACSLAACGGAGGTPSSRPDEVYPEYENNKSMWIGGWDEPLNTEADYKLAKEMGLTHMFIDGFLEPRHSEGYFKQLENCEKAGLKAIVGMDTALKNEGNMPYDETDFSVYPAVDMINLWDEPFVENFDAVAERVARANAQYAGKDITLFINFLPGSPGGWQNYIDDMWEKCLSKVNGRKIYSTDIYPLNETRGEYYVSGTWLSRLNMMARAAKNNGGEFHMFIQSYTEQGVCRDLIGREDLTFQIYTDMAFGINGFTYFTYRKSFISGFGGGCVENNVSATPTQIWYWAKEVNEEIAAFDHVYLSFDWDGVYTVNIISNTTRNTKIRVLCSPINSKRWIARKA